MKNLLSKSLLCGVLASTFLIVNCQKAPNRGVKAQATPNAKPNVTKIAACSEDAIKEARSAKEINDALKVALEKVNDKTTDQLTEAEKNDLTNLVNNLFDQSNKLIAEIQKITVTVGDKKEAAEACTAGETSHDIIVIRSVVARLGKTVKEKTGLDNKATPKAEETLVNGQELSASKALADFLSDAANAKGGAVIVNGKIEKGNAANLALKDANATACSSLNEQVKTVAEKSIVKVITVGEATLDAALSRNISRLALEIRLADGSYPVVLSCQIEDKKEKAAAVEIRKALGNLVSIVEPTPTPAPAPAPAPNPASNPASNPAPNPGSGDSTPASGDSTPGSTASKARASEALRILDNAMSRM